MREQIAIFCIVVFRSWYLITPSERDWVSPSEWMPDEKMKSFHHRLIPASSLWVLAAHKRSIYSETYPAETIQMLSMFPVYTDSTLESSHASSRGSGSGGERLNNALIQLVWLESHNPPTQKWDRGRAGKTKIQSGNASKIKLNELEGTGYCNI